MHSVLIRPESGADNSCIREVNIEAFADHPISQHTEHSRATWSEVSFARSRMSWIRLRR